MHEGIDSEPIPGPSQHYHNPNFINNLPTISFPRNSSSIKRKHLASHSESATPSVLNTFNDNSKRHVKNAGTQTEPLSVLYLGVVPADKRIKCIKKIFLIEKELSTRKISY